jgi:mannose-6-phosphate isomerase-like protein (cupin superfamily)
MRLINRKEIKKTIKNPLGEEIFEMIGADKDLGQAEKHSLAFVKIPPGKSSAKHWHKISEETYYITKGKGEMVVAGKRFDVKAGSAVFIKPPEKHMVRNTSSVDLEFVVVSAPPWNPEDSFF